MRLRHVLAVLLAVPACHTDYRAENAERAARLRDRAAFEMGCTTDELLLTPLAESPDKPVTTQYGVDCHGTRAVYVHSPGGWVLNSQRPDSDER